MPSPSKAKAARKVARVMHEFKEGDLESSSGDKVRSRKQAIAIGLSEARRSAGPRASRRASPARDASEPDPTAHLARRRRRLGGRRRGSGFGARRRRGDAAHSFAAAGAASSRAFWASACSRASSSSLGDAGTGGVGGSRPRIEPWRCAKTQVNSAPSRKICADQ
jgi:Family of unknown function (DUF6496)